jgi:uncharacterized protein (TIGR04255 family)
MPLNLPAPDEARLPHSPLALAVCQVQFDDPVAVSDSRVILEMHQTLGGRQGPYPKVERIQTAGFDIRPGPAGLQPMAALPQQTGWRLQSDDKGWFVSIMPNYAALETPRYTSWDEFRNRLSPLLQAVAKHIAPATEQRLGLRYLNHFTEPEVTDPQGWREYIAPELLGLILHERLGPAVIAAQQQVDLDVGDEARASLRHGTATDLTRDGALIYVLDFDIYREGLRTFDVADIEATADTFNHKALQLFQQSVTSTMLDFLRREGHDE